MRSRSVVPRVVALLLSAGAALAQIGDRLDKPGMVQESLVPRELIPPAPALSPAEALQSFQLAPGIRLEVAAAEPLVQEPVAMAFGPDGRMWVVEMRGYMPDLDGTGEDRPVGRVVVLSDKDGDGRYDESKVFVDQLVLPRAILVVGDGALVGAPPELAYWRDTDGDGKADKKVVVATDYGVAVDPKRPFLANPERAPNGLLWAHDNWIYSAAYTKKFRFVNGEFETRPTLFRGQWGLGQDAFGRLFYGSNSDQLRVDVIFADYLGRNPNYPRLAGTNVNAAVNQLVWPARVTPGVNRGYRPEMLRDGRLKEFTAACGFYIYDGDLFPEFSGNAFVAEPAANFVRRNIVRSEKGVPRGDNAYQQKEFVASTDERFRPVNFATGPDGALYIVDLYRGVLQHRISLTSYLRKQSEERKLVGPQHLGRIYRVVPADRPVPRGTKIPALTAAQWVERLGDRNAWWRDTAQRILVERRDASVVPALRRAAASAALPAGRVHALWTLDGMDALDRATVLEAIGDQEAVVRVAAIRLSERFLRDAKARDEVASRVLRRLDDAAPEVQLQAVLTLGELGDLETDLAVARHVRASSANPFLRDAFFSGIAHHELALLEKLVADPAWTPDDADANKILSGLARGVFATRELPAVERVIALAANQPAGAGKRALALVDGMYLAAADMRRPLTFAAEPRGWSAIAGNAAFKSRVARLNPLVIWPGKPGAEALAVATPLTEDQQTRFANGQTLFNAICAACHQTSGRGQEGLAPPLLDSEWVLGPEERIIRIALHGVRGPIRVLGRTHTGDMPAFGGLDDEQLASILTYVRRAWGHTASPVEPARVKATRAATAEHTDAFSPEELTMVK